MDAPSSCSETSARFDPLITGSSSDTGARLLFLRGRRLAFDLRCTLRNGKTGAMCEGLLDDASLVFSMRGEGACFAFAIGVDCISTTFVLDAADSWYGGGAKLGAFAAFHCSSFFRILRISNATAMTDNASAATPTPMPAFAPVLRPFPLLPPKKKGGADPLGKGGRAPVAVRNGGSSVNGLPIDGPVVDDRNDEVDSVMLADIKAESLDMMDEVVIDARVSVLIVSVLIVSVLVVAVSTGVAVTEVGMASFWTAVVVAVSAGTTSVTVVSDIVVKRVT
jgi:hypothetical protein